MQMSDSNFRHLSDFIHAQFGIKMPDSKKVMLESRLRKRLRKLGMNSFKQYCEYLFSAEGLKNEKKELINVVSTNKTDFFRESIHFDYLVKTALPALINSRGAGVNKTLKVWSAGCSTGEEPYTIAMVLNDFSEQDPRFHFQIQATDISLKVLEQAALGIYEQEKIQTIPLSMKQKYFLKSKNKAKNLVRVIPELRKTIKFKKLNFMDENFGTNNLMDIIFCRNVIIYFDKPTQEKVLKNLCRHLAHDGYIFMGHSETLHWLELPLTQVSQTIYRKKLMI